MATALEIQPLMAKVNALTAHVLRGGYGPRAGHLY
jgi:hypothetical protein